MRKRREDEDPDHFNYDSAALATGLQVLQEGDVESAFEYWMKVAEFGDRHAHFGLSFLKKQGNNQFCVVLWQCKVAYLGITN